MIWLKIKKFWYLLVAGASITALGVITLSDNPIDTYDEMLQVQQAYFQQYGKYLQIIPDNRLPHYISGTVKEKIGSNVGSNWKVDIYETPKKEQGFQAFWEDSDNRYSKGVGPESSSRDYMIAKPINVASTTGWIWPELPKFTLDIPSLFNEALAALSGNSYSTDLELDSTQFWSITDTNQIGLDFSNNLTFAVWIRPESSPAPAYSLISKRAAAGNNRSYDWIITDTIVQFVSWSDGITVGCNFDFTQTFSANTWYHVVVVKSGTSLSSYIDGVQIGTTQTCTSADIFNGNAEVRIGNRTDGGNPFDGLLDDVRVWSRALTGEEIYLLYNDSCNFPLGTGLEGFWKFDNDGLDFSNNTNDLTNNNIATFVRDWAPSFRCKQVIYSEE